MRKDKNFPYPTTTLDDVGVIGSLMLPKENF